MVFESVVVDVLNRFLGDYVVNLDKSQLSLGIWGGNETAVAAQSPPGARCRLLALCSRGAATCRCCSGGQITSNPSAATGREPAGCLIWVAGGGEGRLEVG